MAASGADRVLDEAELYDTLEAAIADCTFVLATTARAHDQAKPVVDAARGGAAAGADGRGRRDGRRRCSGASAYGLENHEVALADRDRDAAGQSGLRLAQSGAGGADRRLRMVQARDRRRAAVRACRRNRRRRRASSCSPSSPISSASWRRSSSSGPPDKRDTMQINLRNIFTACSRRSRTSRRCTASSWRSPRAARARRAAACSTASEAELLRTLLAEHGEGRVPNERGPVRGLARLLRRNPTDAERMLWDALTQGPPLRRPRLQAADAGRPAYHRLRVVPAAAGDRSRAGGGKRGGSEGACRTRAWLSERGYRVVAIGCRRRVERDIASVLDRLRCDVHGAGRRFVNGKFHQPTLPAVT